MPRPGTDYSVCAQCVRIGSHEHISVSVRAPPEKFANLEPAAIIAQKLNALNLAPNFGDVIMRQPVYHCYLGQSFIFE